LARSRSYRESCCVYAVSIFAGNALALRAPGERTGCAPFVLHHARKPQVDAPGLETPEDHRIAKLVEAGSHPDLRWKRCDVKSTNLLATRLHG